MLSQRSLGAAGTGLVLPSDDLFNTVSFLSHFDGANNGKNNVYDDSSSSNHTITANGNVTQGSFGPFARPDGQWGVSFDGSADFIEGPSVDLLGSGAFTVECWVNVPSKTTASNYTDAFLAQYQSNGNLIIGSKSNVVRVWMGSSEVRVGTVGIVGNGWHHIALTRNSSGSVRLFVDGSADGAAFTNSTDFSQNLENFEIGSWDNGANSALNGNISNLRVVKGTAVYDPSASTITVPTSSLTAIANTSLLTCQSNRFVDNSTNSHTLTPSGQTAVSAFGPFLTSEVYDAGVNGASAYFVNEVGEYLDTPASSDFAFGTGDFTVEFWFYQEVSGYRVLIDQVYGNLGISIWINDSRQLIFYYDTSAGGGYGVATTAAVNYNEWNHVALVRSSGVTRIYANGVSGATYSDSNNYTSTTGLTVSADYNSNLYLFKGYMSDVRAVKGTAVYTSNFTPPTAPLTAVTNTKLLLNMADGQAIDSAAQNNLTLVGTAKTSTAQSKFGGASLLLDGNSDYANFPETGANDIDGAGDWTAEFFWRFNNNTSPIYQMLLTKGFGLQIYTINGALAIALSASNSGTYFISTTGGTTLSNDTWYHVALVKNGTSYKVYLDGTHETNLGGTNSSTVGTGGGSWHIGAIEGSELTYPANGYMDEVRISRLARYTANFTPPTEPFADKGQ